MPSRMKKTVTTTRTRNVRGSSRRGRKTFRRQTKKLGISTPRTLSFAGFGMPDQFFTKLKYFDAANNSAAGVFTIRTFRSSLYDPDLTNAGHQPMNYDQISVLYNYYQVMGMKVKVEIINNSTSTALNVAAGFSLTQPPSYAGVDYYGEDKRFKRWLVPQAGSNNIARRNFYVSSKSILGQKAVLETEDLQSPTNANPSLNYVFNIVTGSCDGITTVSYVQRVEIIYYCRFFGKVMEPGS